MNRRSKDFILESLTYLASSIGILILLLIIGFVFIRGYKVLSFDFVFGQYKSEPTWVKVVRDTDSVITRPTDLAEDVIWSEKWGIGLLETRNRDKKHVLLIDYIHEDSPFKDGGIKYTSSDESGKTKTVMLIPEGISLSAYRTDFRMPAKEAEPVIDFIEDKDEILLEVTIPAGGIRGSILTTLVMVVVTLVLALPFGIAIALYLTEYARKSKIILVMRSMIDMLAGVPSIVYGIVGVLLFFRYFPLGGENGGYTVLGGSLTLVAILLPVIIRSTEVALLAVPQELRHASLALGANRSQTIYKIILPSAIPGILTAILLSIGRIIGESAALILVAGTMVNDSPRLREGGATLAVHIWKEMSGEQPNIEVAAAISIIIIIIVLLLNVLVKVTSRYFNKANY